MAEELEKILRAEIARMGPLPFARFAELALYHPEHGYYSSGRAAIGRRGDYFTSVSVGPLFGGMLAMQFAELWEKLGAPSPFVLVEQGAHDGQLAHDVLGALRKDAPEFFAALRYRIVEPFPRLAARQREKLESFGARVEWVELVEEMKPFRGVHFSNELVDAMPVHLVVADSGEWKERCVMWEGNGFGWTIRPLSDAALRAALPAPPNEHYQTEVNLAALRWLDSLAPKLEQGLILIADYGLARADFYAPHRRAGTLQSYASHRVLASPFEQIGESDLSAHVEWTSLAERAEKHGLTLGGFTDQHHFLTGLLAQNPRFAEAPSRALQTLLHPEFLGTRFQFLGLTKSCEVPLSGFHFAGDSRARIGLA